MDPGAAADERARRGLELIDGNRTEAAFHRWGELVVRHRWWVLALSLLATLWMVSWLPGLQIDNSTEAFLRPDDPAQIRYNEFRNRFDRDDRIVIALAPPDVFDPLFLERLRGLHLALEDRLPYTEEITSLMNARSTRGEGDELIVEDLLEGWREQWPPPAAAGPSLRERVLANPIYRDTLVSRDARLTTLTIKPLTWSTLAGEDALAGFDEPGDGSAEPAAGDDRRPPQLLSAKENDALLAELRAVMAEFEAEGFPMHLGGPLAVTDQINRSMERDMGVFMVICIAMILVLLGVLFRRLSGALLPLAVVGLAVLSAIGVMVALEIPGTVAVQILPVFLLSVGICDAVHILAITYQRLDAGDRQQDAIAYAIGHSGLAVVMTSLTTAAGMASFVTAEMAPIGQLGVIAPIGVMLALVYTLVLLPAVLALVPLRPPRAHGGARSPGRLVRAMLAVGDYSVVHPWRVLAISAVFVAVCALGALQVRFSHLALAWFQPDDPVRVANEVIDQGLRGSMSLEVIADTGRAGGLYEPAALQRIEAAMRWAEGAELGEVFVGKALSVVDVVKEIHQALNENRPDQRRLPEDRELVAQELLLFESAGADDLEELVDTELRSARISLRAPFVDAMYYRPAIDAIAAGMREILGPDIAIEMTGFMPVLAGVVRAMITSMARSYVIALVVITPLMILLLRDLRLGLLSMIPNLVPVLFGLGLMGWVGFPLDATTIMIGAMVIGLAVDDTIHFMHKFRLYFAHTGDARLAVRETLTTTGSALLFTSLVLAGGFFVLCMASMINTRNFGLIAAGSALVAFAADLVIGPALMSLATRRRRRDQALPEEGASPLVCSG